MFLSDFMCKLYVKNMIKAYYVRKEVILQNTNVARKKPTHEQNMVYSSITYI